MLQKIITTLISKNYTLATRRFQLNIVGIRSLSATPDSFDDTINIFYKQADGQWAYNTFAATTDPGTYWLRKPVNSNGTAILKPGQYINAYCLGMHRNKYLALVQQLPVTVIRDGNKDNVLNFNNKNEQSGIFGINMHRAEIKGKTKYINHHSAGCQVLSDADDFKLLIQLAQRHRLWYGNNFTYTLLQEQELLNVAKGHNHI